MPAGSSHYGAIGSGPLARPEIREEMKEIAGKRLRFGYCRTGILPERKGMLMTLKSSAGSIGRKGVR